MNTGRAEEKCLKMMAMKNRSGPIYLTLSLCSEGLQLQHLAKGDCAGDLKHWRKRESL